MVLLFPRMYFPCGGGAPSAQRCAPVAVAPPDARHRSGSMESAALRAPTCHARPSTARCRFAPSGAACRPRRAQRFRRWTAPGPPPGYGRLWRPLFINWLILAGDSLRSTACARGGSAAGRTPSLREYGVGSASRSDRPRSPEYGSLPFRAVRGGLPPRARPALSPLDRARASARLWPPVAAPLWVCCWGIVRGPSPGLQKRTRF